MHRNQSQPQPLLQTRERAQRTRKFSRRAYANLPPSTCNLLAIKFNAKYLSKLGAAAYSKKKIFYHYCKVVVVVHRLIIVIYIKLNKIHNIKNDAMMASGAAVASLLKFTMCVWCVRASAGAKGVKMCIL